MNPKDEELVALLAENARMSVSELARRLSSSRTATQMRLQKLERNGTIEAYTLRLSPRYLAQNLQAIVMVKFTPKDREQVEAALCKLPQLKALYSISGEFDMAGILSARSMDDLDVVIDKIGCIDGIDETKSSIILSTKLDR